VNGRRDRVTSRAAARQRPSRSSRCSIEGALDREAVRRQDRAVAPADIDLLTRQPAGEEQLYVFDRGRSASRHLVMHRGDRRPDLSPRLPSRCTEYRRMLRLAKEGNVGIIVDQPQFGTKPERDRDARVETYADRGFDALRPGFGGGQAVLATNPWRANARPSRRPQRASLNLPDEVLSLTPPVWTWACIKDDAAAPCCVAAPFALLTDDRLCIPQPPFQS